MCAYLEIRQHQLFMAKVCNVYLVLGSCRSTSFRSIWISIYFITSIILIDQLEYIYFGSLLCSDWRAKNRQIKYILMNAVIIISRLYEWAEILIWLRNTKKNTQSNSPIQNHWSDAFNRNQWKRICQKYTVQAQLNCMEFKFAMHSTTTMQIECRKKLHSHPLWIKPLFCSVHICEHFGRIGQAKTHSPMHDCSCSLSTWSYLSSVKLQISVQKSIRTIISVQRFFFFVISIVVTHTIQFESLCSVPHG